MDCPFGERGDLPEVAEDSVAKASVCPGKAGPGEGLGVHRALLRGRVGLHLTLRGMRVSGVSPWRAGVAGPADAQPERRGGEAPGCHRSDGRFSLLGILDEEQTCLA